MKNSNTAATPANITIPQEIMAKVKIPRTFEIFVEEFDEEHEPGVWKPVRYDPKLGGDGGNPVITVESQQDMIEKTQFYKKIGQRFRIVREIDPPTPQQILEIAKQQGIDTSCVDEQPADGEQHASVSAEPAPLRAVQEPVCQTAAPVAAPCAKPKTRIVTIGDVQIKYDGDKIYQRQWIKLSQQESANIRVINTQTNKIVPLTGKHIEVKKWVLVEDEADSDISDLDGDLQQ